MVVDIFVDLNSEEFSFKSILRRQNILSDELQNEDEYLLNKDSRAQVSDPEYLPELYCFVIGC